MRMVCQAMVLIRRCIPALLGCVLIGGCSLQSLHIARPIDPMGFSQISGIGHLNEYRGKSAAKATGKPCLTLEECKNLALNKNLGLHVKRWDELSLRSLASSRRWAMLPSLVAFADTARRDTLPFSFSDVITQEGLGPTPPAAGADVTAYHTDQERNRRILGVESRWSPNDAVGAFIRYHGTWNEQAQVRFDRIRSAQRILGDVESTYYRLIGLQESLRLAEKLVKLRAENAGKARKLLGRNLIDVEKFHRVRGKADSAEQLLARLRSSMERHRNLLATCIGLSPEHCNGGFYVTGKLCRPDFKARVCELEMSAIKTRPEPYMAGLEHANAILDKRLLMIDYLPKITGYWRYLHDENHFLLNEDSHELGVAAYIDFTKLLENYGKTCAAERKIAATRSKIGAAAVGISSEVRLASLDYIDSLREAKSARGSVSDAEKLREVMRGRSTADETDRVSVRDARADVVEAKINEIRALAEANAAFARLKAALGSNYSEDLSCK